VLFSQDMNTVQDLHWLPERAIKFARGDAIRVQWANSDARTYGLELLWTALGV